MDSESTMRAFNSTHLRCTVSAKVRMQPTLDWTIQQEVFSGRLERRKSTSYRLVDCMLQFLLCLIRTTEYVEHRTYVNTNISLEIDYLFHTYLHITIDIGLKGT
jgi:hypothetical protein